MRETIAGLKRKTSSGVVVARRTARLAELDPQQAPVVIEVRHTST